MITGYQWAIINLSGYLFPTIVILAGIILFVVIDADIVVWQWQFPVGPTK
jgi:hypothetical protein